MIKYKLFILLIIILVFSSFIKGNMNEKNINTENIVDTFKVVIYVNPDSRIIFQEEANIFICESFFYAKLFSTRNNIDTIIKLNNYQISKLVEFKDNLTHGFIKENLYIGHRAKFFYFLKFKNLIIKLNSYSQFSIVDAILYDIW